MAEMFNPPHPGEILEDALESLGLSARQFAAHIGASPTTISRILRGGGYYFSRHGSEVG